jgi:hypothetical protein
MKTTVSRFVLATLLPTIPRELRISKVIALSGSRKANLKRLIDRTAFAMAQQCARQPVRP